MTPSLDLFRLIKSLTPTEKSYFKKFSSFTKSQSGKNVYLLLFDAIAAQNEYDESKLKKKFQGQPFIRQLPVVKNYLHSRILDSLALYHSEMNPRVTVRNTLNKAEILRKKGLYDQAMKLLRKMKLFAKENEMHLPLMDAAIHIEQGLALEKYDMKWFENVNKEIFDNLSLFRNDAALHELNFKIAVYYHKYQSTRNPAFLRKAKEVINSKYLSDVSQAKTFFGRNRFFESHAFYALAKGDMKSVYENTKKVVSNYETSPGMVDRNFLSYISALNNFINVCGELRKNEEGLKMLGKLVARPDLVNAVSIQARVFYTYNYLFLFLNNNSGNFSEAAVRIAGIANELKMFEEEMNDSEKAMMYVNMAITYFGLNDLKECIRLLNKIRNDLNMENHPEMDCFVRLFYLIAHYQSRNTDLMPYLIQSNYRFFSKKKDFYRLEAVFLELLKTKIAKAKTEDQKIEAFKEMKSKFIPLVNHPQEKSYFKYFDFISWIDSKINNQMYSETLLKKYSKS